MCVHVPGIQPQTVLGPPDTCCKTGQKPVLPQQRFMHCPAAVKRGAFRDQGDDVPVGTPSKVLGKGYFNQG